MPLDQSTTDKIYHRLAFLYGDKATDILSRIKLLAGKYPKLNGTELPRDSWTHKSVYVISYGDSLLSEKEEPIPTLKRFIDEKLNNLITGVHILPFFPYSSDDGFSVIDYRKVREDLGDWDDVKDMAKRYRVMADLVINHISSKSDWFQEFLDGRQPGLDYFHTKNIETDYGMVTRPRSTPLLTPVQTNDGVKHVWTTFSPDQVDVNFANPDVLLEYIDILLFYLANHIKVIRLDAVAFLWKKDGTNCIHLKETHEVVKLIRDLVEAVAPDTIIITETNVPHDENISYYGDGDEAHMVYNFSLPPLLFHAILTGNASYLSEWSRKLTPPPEGCTYFNFSASHDGIGVRPLEGLVPQEDFDLVVQAAKDRGGFVSYKQNPNGVETPYELNITFFDAFKDPDDPENVKDQIKRFMCSQILMLSFRGVPAIYIHCLTATPNYHEGVKETGVKRTINRRKWKLSELEEILEDEEHPTTIVLNAWKQILTTRRTEPAFHPESGKEVMETPNEIFSMLRLSPDGSSAVIVVANVSDKNVSYNIPLSPLEYQGPWVDLISRKRVNPRNKIPLEPWQIMWIKIR